VGKKPSYEELECKVAELEAQVSLGRQVEDEKRALEMQLIQSQKMESLGTLAGGIVHDFNNILAPIIGYTEMMLSEVPEASSQQQHLYTILEATDRARDLVQRILTFSHQTLPERKPVKIQPVVEEALKLLRSSLPATIEIRRTIEDGCGQVKADVTQIHQMVMNLGTNAFHAMREKGGVLEVTLEEVKISQDRQVDAFVMATGTYLHLAMKDTGHGIDGTIIDRIFEPYFTTKKMGEGTGLGLSLVHSIVKDHGGKITVRSEADTGTEFHIYLPRIITATTSSCVDTEHAVPGGEEHILLVDDEPQVIQMEQDMLEKLGYRVTPQADSRGALAAFRHTPGGFDMVITDLTMPHMTGDELSRALLDIRPDIPIILNTGFSEVFSEDQALSLGIRAYLTKPVGMNQIAVTIRDILDQAQVPLSAPQLGASANL